MVDIRRAGPWDYIRFVLSSLVLLFSMVVTTYAIVERKTGFWHTVPGWAALILFVIDLFILGIVEGLQIALVELKRQHPDAYKKTHPAAYKLGQLAAKGDNVERFLMGRQVFVVVLVFFCAKLTTITLEDGEQFLFPVPYWVNSVFFETGILACIVVVIIAQLMPQILAAKYPVHFLQFLVMRPAYYACVFVETTGLTHVCWVLSALLGYATGMHDDETTVNPVELQAADEVLEDISSSLNSVVIGVDENESRSDKRPLYDTALEKNPLLPGNQFSRFTKLVEKTNETISPDTLRVVKHYLDSHPEKFRQFPSVIGNKMYPAPQSIAQQIESNGYPVPKFLTDISDEEHVPPHIVACELLAQNRQLREEMEQLQVKLSSV